MTIFILIILCFIQYYNCMYFLSRLTHTGTREYDNCRIWNYFIYTVYNILYSVYNILSWFIRHMFSTLSFTRRTSTYIISSVPSTAESLTINNKLIPYCTELLLILMPDSFMVTGSAKKLTRRIETRLSIPDFQ